MVKPSDTVTEFLEKIQGLILSSQLNNTYKMALLIAIAEQSLEFRAEDKVKSYFITYESLAREFLQLYWPQSVPFVADRATLAEPLAADLRQGNNTGLLKVISLIREFKKACNEPTLTFTRAEMMGKDFDRLVKHCVQTVVRKNPLEYLKGADFLYILRDDLRAVEISSQTLFSLQRFHPLIISLAQNRWEQRIRELPANVELLGGSRVNSLHSYLFNPHRTDNLSVVRTVLQDATEQEDCFYCGRKLTKDIHVDHFIPYSRFTPMRIHNFVLSCPRCNTSKSDVLASERHLEHWVSRNDDYGDDMAAAATDYGIPAERRIVDLRCVALYEHEMASEGVFWDAALTQLEPTRFVHSRSMPALDELRRRVVTQVAVMP